MNKSNKLNQSIVFGSRSSQLFLGSEALRIDENFPVNKSDVLEEFNQKLIYLRDKVFQMSFMMNEINQVVKRSKPSKSR